MHMQHASAPPARFSLLDDFQRSYVKYKGREPRTLEELAIAEAEREYSQRLAEIKAMREKLALLDAFAPDLDALGIKLGYRTIKKSFLGSSKAPELRLWPSFSLKDDKLYAALLQLSFREIERKDSGSSDTVRLKHGRSLVIVLEVSKQEMPATATAAQAGA